jgi:dihydroorotase-like cyclic amidohydrolase
MKGQLNIDTIYAFIQRDVDGTEGLIGALTPIGWMPLVGADLQRAASYEKTAQDVADATGRPVSLVHFSKREEIKLITPNRMSETKGIRLGEDDNILGIK